MDMQVVWKATNCDTQDVI